MSVGNMNSLQSIVWRATWLCAECWQHEFAAEHGLFLSLNEIREKLGLAARKEAEFVPLQKGSQKDEDNILIICL